jgi:hypothetical protein
MVPLTVQIFNHRGPVTLDAYDDYRLLKYLRENPISGFIISSPHRKGFLLEIYSSEGAGHNTNMLIIILTSQLDGRGAAFVRNTVNLQGIASDWTFKKIKLWLNECEGAHDLYVNDKVSCLPKRVLNIGLDGDLRIRLYISKKGERSKYVALSYY